jgi:3-oxoacyl-[acyl-carrier protein] reductase
MGTLMPFMGRIGELEGKRAIITGASRGLGAAIADALWQYGADVLLVARSKANLRELGNRLLASRKGAQSVHLFAADLREPNTPQGIFSEARRIWPRIDVLVNNAGIIGPIGTLADNDWGEWRDAIQLNLLAPAALCRLAIDWMRTDGGGGSIINLSGGGATSPRPRFSAYATAKCGLVRFSETIATEVADLGIRVNCVAPGAMNTEMLQAILRAGADRVGRDEFDKTVKMIAAGATDPRIAAKLVVYLATEKSAGVTGKLISAVWDPWRNLHEHIDDLRTTDIYTLRRVVPNDRGKEWANG